MPSNPIVDNIESNIMLTSIVKKIKRIPSYFYRNYIAPRIFSIRDRKILSKNLELKNKYIGQRCFIIGGGPSITDIDLSRLNQEFTFVTNEFEKNKQYHPLNPKFHLISDSLYYAEDLDSYWLARFQEKDKDIPVRTTMLLNMAALPFVKKHGLFKNHEVFYIGTQGIMTDKLPFSIELDKYVPMPKNSLLLSLISACYMGFSPIYILGCEHDFLAHPLKPGEHTVTWYPYSYMDPNLKNIDAQAAKKYTSVKDSFMSYEDIIVNTLQLFKNYRLFYRQAKQEYPNIQIFNATPNSFLDVFPMINFEDIKP